MPIGVSLQLHDGATPQANLSGIQALWWDVSEPKDAGTPVGRSDAVSTDASGYVTLDLSNVSGLTVGDYGFLTLYKLDAADHKDSLVFSGKVQTSVVALGDVLDAVSDWGRPADWLPMPTTAANQIDVLAAVFDHESNYCALKITLASGAYDVDWGDGTSDLGCASNVKIDHLYNYAAAALDGSLSAEGYKQALVKITPSSGSGDITAISFAEKHSRAGLVTGVTNPWLEVQANVPGLSYLSFYSSVATCRMLQWITFVSLADVTSLSSSYQNCSSLVGVIYPAGSLVNVSSLSYAHSGCSSLRFSAYPDGSLGAVATLSNAYSGCGALEGVYFPVGSLGLVITLLYAFNGCNRIRRIIYPSGSLVNLESLERTYTNCPSLEQIIYPSGSLVNVTRVDYAHNGCVALQSVVYPAGSLALVTNASGAFANISLANITNCAIPVSFTVANCKLSGEALNEIYSALPTVSGQTITVTGNHGVVDDDPSIATAKGWTVTG